MINPLIEYEFDYKTYYALAKAMSKPKSYIMFRSTMHDEIESQAFIFGNQYDESWDIRNLAKLKEIQNLEDFSSWVLPTNVELANMLRRQQAHIQESIDELDRVRTFDLVEYLTVYREFSERTYGPPSPIRLQGVIDHLRKEVQEISEAPMDQTEWVDVVILALDGLWRIGLTSEEVAQAITDKVAINMDREWPDWRNVDPSRAIEHIKSNSGNPRHDHLHRVSDTGQVMK